MNPFVNPNQRGIDLPPGCKDLIDVTKPNVPGMETMHLPGSDAELLKAPFRRFYELGDDHVIAILIQGSHCFLSLTRLPGPPVLGFGLHKQHADFNKTVRDFFATKDIPALLEKDTQRGIIVVRYHLPATAIEAAELISPLLQQIYQETKPIQLMLFPAPKGFKMPSVKNGLN